MRAAEAVGMCSISPCCVCVAALGSVGCMVGVRGLRGCTWRAEDGVSRGQVWGAETADTRASVGQGEGLERGRSHVYTHIVESCLDGLSDNDKLNH